MARTALAHGHRLIMAAINDEPFDLKAAIKAIKTEINDRYLGPSTGCIVDAAGERRIPTSASMTATSCNWAMAPRSRIWTAESDQTSAIAEGIAQDKDFTKRLLAPAACPCPKARSSTAPRKPGKWRRTSAFPSPSSPRTATTHAA